jgi:protein O-GlcNAc transferase
VHFAVSLLVVLSLLLPAPQGQLSDDDFTRAERNYQEGRLAEAEALYARIGPGHPDYPQAQLHLATIFYSTGRPALAERCFRENLRFRESAEVYSLLAGAQFNQEKFDDALESAKKALALDPKNAKAYTALGMVYTARKDWPHADAAYSEALRLDPKDSSTWFLQGRCYFLRNEFAKAREAFETALKLYPQSVRTYENLALTLDLLGQPAAAEIMFLRGVEANRRAARPEARIYIAYAAFLFKIDRLEESETQLREAVKVEPQNPEVRYELARVLSRRKQWKEAASQAEAALRAGKPDYRVHFLLSRIYTALGDPQAASFHAQRAAQLADRKQLRSEGQP